MGHRVTAPVVQAKKADGSFVHIYEGGFLPSDADPTQLEQLVSAGLVEEADEPEPDDTDAEAPSTSRRRRK